MERKMNGKDLIKNIPFSEPHVLAGLVDYQKGRVISRAFVENNALSMTLFAFDQGEGLITRTTSGDAMVQVVDGEVALTIGGKEMIAKSGEVVVMPADVPHSVNAVKPFKMLLTIVKKPMDRGTKCLPFSPKWPQKAA